MKAAGLSHGRLFTSAASEIPGVICVQEKRCGSAKKTGTKSGRSRNNPAAPWRRNGALARPHSPPVRNWISSRIRQPMLSCVQIINPYQ